MATAVVTSPLSAPSISIPTPSTRSHSSHSTPRQPVPSVAQSLSSTMAPSPSNTRLTEHSQHSDPSDLSLNSTTPLVVHSSTSTVVPQYPYNVSMPPFAGALLPYERAPMPDDNDVQTRLPSICVDYLSHNWDESDVWTSWKAMTRHKHEMANGVRLENASWRTWAKQRSNLKTISPETLNWLKDSDVTWLYGPLHTAVDPVPPPKLSSLQDRFNLDGQAASPTALPDSALSSRPGSSASVRSSKVPGKPILKHRSLSEILGVPSNTTGAGADSGSDGESDREDPEDVSESAQNKRVRVTIAHPASDTTLVNMRDHDPVGRGSPPVMVAGYDSSASGDDSDANRPISTRVSNHSQPPKRKTAFRTSGNNSSGGSGTEDASKPKKHISFSHRVEQCIAVDSEEERGSYGSQGLLRPKVDMRTSSSIEEEDDDDDEEEDVLTFRSSASRHPGINVATHRYASHSNHLLHPTDQPMSQSGSSSSAISFASSTEPHTIARMAPTTLKSSEVLPAPSPVVVYDRSPIWTATSSSTTSPGSGYPVYTVTSSPTGSAVLPNSSTAASIHSTSVSSNARSTPSYYSCTYGPVTSAGGSTAPIASLVPDSSVVTSARYTSSSPATRWSATTNDDDDDTEEFTAMGFDYFSGPDLGLGDEYDMPRLPSQHLSGSLNKGYVAGGINEASSSSRSINPSSHSPPTVNSPCRYGAQAPILVPQLKSQSQKTISTSSSSSSLASSPLSHSQGASSASTTTTTPSHPDKAIAHLPSKSSSASSLLNLVTAVNDRADRMARGRSSSRGSSASSFERSSTDHYRRSSNSPSSQSPPSNVSPHRSIGVVAGSTAGSSQHRLVRSGGSSGSLSRSGDSNRGKSRLINVTIGEEDEDDSKHATDSQEHHSSLEGTGKGSSVMNGQPSNCIGIPGALESTSPQPTVPVAALNLSPGSKIKLGSATPCMISAPRPASTQLAPTPSFEDDVEPKEPSLLSALLLKRSGSMSSLGSLKWADETLPVTPRVVPSGRRSMGEGVGQAKMTARRLSGDDFGFGNYYSMQSEGSFREEIEEDSPSRPGSGVIGKTFETARDLVGAIWNVGSRSIWGVGQNGEG